MVVDSVSTRAGDSKLNWASRIVFGMCLAYSIVNTVALSDHKKPDRVIPRKTEVTKTFNKLQSLYYWFLQWLLLKYQTQFVVQYIPLGLRQ